jgi:hypothetical protein
MTNNQQAAMSPSTVLSLVIIQSVYHNRLCTGEATSVQRFAIIHVLAQFII